MGWRVVVGWGGEGGKREQVCNDDFTDVDVNILLLLLS